MLAGSIGILYHPSVLPLSPDPDVLALFKVDSIYWTVRGDGWEFEVAVVAPDTTNTDGGWEAFAKRCDGNVRKIRETGDDGLFAKLYANDVERLLAMLQGIERSNEGAECVSDAWEDTKP